MAAVACAQVPKITVIVGNSFGAANYMMVGASTFYWAREWAGLLCYALLGGSHATRLCVWVCCTWMSHLGGGFTQREWLPLYVSGRQKHGPAVPVHVAERAHRSGVSGSAGGERAAGQIRVLRTKPVKSLRGVRLMVGRLWTTPPPSMLAQNCCCKRILACP